MNAELFIIKSLQYTNEKTADIKHFDFIAHFLR